MNNLTVSNEREQHLKDVLLDNYAKGCIRADNEGWVNMASLGLNEAKALAIDLGFESVKKAIINLFPDEFEFRPYLIRRIPTNNGGLTSEIVSSEIESSVHNDAKEGILPYKKDLSTTKSTSRNERLRKTAYDKLMEFAFFPYPPNGFSNAIKQLAEEKALKENWFYGNKNQYPGSYPILKNYLLLTFERLLAEDEEHIGDTNWEKKILTAADDDYAVFNTGLVDKLYEPVYAWFRRNNNPKIPRKWSFKSFVKSSDKEHQSLTRIFGTNLPAPAHYYNQTSELVYNVKSEIGSYNWDHFIDNCDRLPLEFLRENGPKFDYEQPNNAMFYKRLSDAIKADSRSMNRIKSRIMDAIRYAIKRVRWNFKTAIPIYYPRRKQISLLLPLALVDEDNIDVALVLEATESGAYIAHTILTLDMAYTNARLITRPDSDWLIAEKISANVSEDFED